MAATYEPIASTTLASSASSVTFSGIAADWTDLRLSCLLTPSTSNVNVFMRLNADTGTNYSRTFLLGNGSSASSNRNANVPNEVAVGFLASTSSLDTTTIDLMSYANTNVYKTVLAQTADATNLVNRIVALWRSTAAITSIRIGASLAAGSTLSLYGIKAA